MSAGAQVLGRTVLAVRAAAAEARGGWGAGSWAALAVLVVAAATPLVVTDSLRLSHLTEWLAFALAALGLAYLAGIGGVPSLAQGAFVGIGAFGTAILEVRGGWPLAAALPVAVAASVAGGLALGLVSMRLRAAFAAAATWLAGWLVALVLVVFPRVSGGPDGLSLPSPSLGRLELEPWLLYELTLAAVALAAGAYALVARGLPGLALAATRQRPAGAAALGIRAARLRLAAFGVAAGVGGLAGALEVQAAGIADPTAYDPLLSFELLAAVVLGGAAAALGPLAGTALVAAAGAAAGGLAAAGAIESERFAPLATAILVFAALSLGGDGIAAPLLARLRGPRPRPRDGALPAAPMPRADPETLRASGLGLRFGEVVALEDVSLELVPGRVCALVGPNGSGKTTALRVLAGTLRPEAGTVTLGGVDVTHADVPQRVGLGIVRTLQATAVFPELTALENVLVGGFGLRRCAGLSRTALATPNARAEAAAARADALGRLAAVGLAGSAERQAGTLSALEQRLLMLATAAAAAPRFLLVDELGAGAAASELPRLVSAVEGLRDDGVALLVVEHDFRLLRRIADHVVVLDAGRVLAEGTPDAVAADPAVRAAYLGTRP